MKREDFIKKLSKLSKEAILTTVFNRMFFRLDEFAKDAEWNDIQLRFNKLMSEDKTIREKMEPLINKKDIKSLSEFISLMNKSELINKKIDAVMKEMDRYNGRLEASE